MDKLFNDSKKENEESEKLNDPENSFEVKRRKKVVMSGIFVENDADVSMTRLVNKHYRRI